MQPANRINMIAQQISGPKDALVQYASNKGVITVTLNRPKALNSLNLQMIRDLTKHMETISQHQVAWFEGAGGKALCAGGDVKVLFENGAKPQDRLTFFRQQFTLDYKISQMKTLQISSWDGIVMGGGVGLTTFAPVIIATEKTLFAMPEAKLGFFTDVGANYLLSRLRNNLGLYLGMTGARIKGQEAFIAGIAHYYIPSEKLKLVYEEIQQSASLFTKDNTKELVHSILKKYHSPSGKTHLQGEQQINKLFSLSSSREIYLQALNKQDPFHTAIAKLLEQQCPVSVQLIFRLIHRARSLSLRQCFILDYQIIEHMAVNYDFREGVRCVLIQKGAVPKWSSPSLLEIKEETVAAFLTPVKDTQPLPI